LVGFKLIKVIFSCQIRVYTLLCNDLAPGWGMNECIPMHQRSFIKFTLYA